MANDYPDFEGDKSGIHLKADWAAHEGIDKNIFATLTNCVKNAVVVGSYLVPAGKTLYVTEFSFAIWATNAADADNNQFGYAYLVELGLGLVTDIVGGNGGGFMPLAKPAVFTAGQTMRAVVSCQTNHFSEIRVTAHGYEV